jgi:hypothetical protein
MTDKNFMSGGGGNFGGGGASGNWVGEPGAKWEYGTGTVINDTRQYDQLGNVISGEYGYTQGNPQSDAETNRLNAYAHQTNNVVPSSADIKLAFQANLLDNYDVVTYHYKLFMVSTDDSSTGNVLNAASQVVIAESGVTDLTIDKVELNAIAVPSVETGTGTQTLVKFEIVEPAGAGLLDKMYYESIDLGIGNWAVMPLYLQLEFRGRNPETSDSEINGMPGAIGNLRWLWALKITEIKANVTPVGTRYEFSAIIYNEFAQTNAAFSIQHNITLTNFTTFGKAISELEDKVNKDQLLKLLDNYGKPDVYKFVVDPEIAGYQVDTSNTTSKRNDPYIVLEGKSANFNVGAGIDKIIDTLLTHTKEYQEKLTGAKTPGAEGDPASAAQSQMKSFWRIITESRPIEYDARRNDNAIEYTIFIIAYDIGMLDANLFQTTGITPEIAAKRVATYANKGLLKKKYNYMFTGLNDQIVSLDLNLNHSFATAMSRYGGVYLNSATGDTGTVNNNTVTDELRISSALRKVISLQNDAKATQQQRAQAAEEYNAAMSASKLPADRLKVYNDVLTQSKPENKLNYALFGNNYSINRDNPISQNSRTARKMAQPVASAGVGFVSDVNIQSEVAKSMYADFLKTPKGGQLRPIAYREAVQNDSTGPGIVASSNSGSTKLASVFSTALHSGMDANLVSIKLTIKGDPFWLFPQPIQNNNDILFNSLKPVADAIKHLKQGQNALPGSVNMYGADNFILLRFRTPRIFDVSDNDSDEFTEIETFSGIYKVITVKSRFEMGKFVQDLECILDPVINLKDISALVEFDAANQSIPTTPDNFIPFKKYNASNAPEVAPAIIPNTDADLARLTRAGYSSYSEANAARLKGIRG